MLGRGDARYSLVLYFPRKVQEAYLHPLLEPCVDYFFILHPSILQCSFPVPPIPTLFVAFLSRSHYYGIPGHPYFCAAPGVGAAFRVERPESGGCCPTFHVVCSAGGLLFNLSPVLLCNIHSHSKLLPHCFVEIISHCHSNGSSIKI